MRIIAGTARGRRLEVADRPGLRPTGDRQRETLFNVIAPRVPAAAVLDLFAGTGALGIEALSRGAARAVFVERDRAAARALQRNVDRCGVADRVRSMTTPWERATRLLEREGEGFDLVFADPPWRLQEAEAWLAALAPLTRPGGLLCLERRKGDECVADASWEPIRVLEVGDTAFHLLERIEPTSGGC